MFYVRKMRFEILFSCNTSSRHSTFKCSPATDPVVCPEIPLVGPEPVGGGPVPLGVDEHVVAHLVGQPRDGALHGQVPLLHVRLEHLKGTKIDEILVLFVRMLLLTRFNWPNYN